MKTILIFILLFTGVTLVHAEQMPLIAQCSMPKADEPVVKTDDFFWSMSLEQMDTKFKDIYASGKRLKGRAFYDPSKKEYFLPTSWGKEKKKILIPAPFLKSITKHIEEALRRRAVDFIFFPDMGHSHFFIPQKIWDQGMEKINDRELLYEKMFATPELKILYHTAEQLKMQDGDGVDAPLTTDRRLLWRYFTRNLVGKNNGSDELEIYYNWSEKFNTLRELEGHYYYGGGFNISSSKNGCFPYRWNGKTYYFDLSLEDLPSSHTGDDTL